jgi:2-polyprenyl-6-methoxyphenol hydroxylase-like FAD-dependent oxidoreductase
MAREVQTEVLVVGAGPVGLLTALTLAREGVQVKIIDEEERTATHSYACALHPRTLQLLDQAGLAGEATRLGRRIETVAFYEGQSRRAQIELSRLNGDFPYVLVLSQRTLEDLLEQALAHKAGIKVDWNHRLSDLRTEGSTVVAAVDKRYETSTGYIVPHWQWVVQKTIQTRASFLVGADGHNSLVRQRLGIECERVAEPEIFAIYEFESDAELGREVRVVLDEQTSNVLWPMPGGHCRWSFQLPRTAEGVEFPRKDRMAAHVQDTEMDEEVRGHVREFVQQRAPWFKGSVGEIDWCTLVQLDPRLVTHFGQGNCWLAGDAAHQARAVGMHSMNGGLNEAVELADLLKNILREKAPASLLDA